MSIHGRFTTLAVFVACAGVLVSAYAFIGPSSSAPPYVLGADPTVITASILTTGDAVGGYRLAGIPDGLGAFDNYDGTFTLLVNHEISSSLGVARAHGAKGAFVSKWIIHKGTLAVLHGRPDDGRRAPGAARSRRRTAGVRRRLLRRRAVGGPGTAVADHRPAARVRPGGRRGGAPAGPARGFGQAAADGGAAYGAAAAGEHAGTGRRRLSRSPGPMSPQPAPTSPKPAPMSSKPAPTCDDARSTGDCQCPVGA